MSSMTKPWLLAISELWQNLMHFVLSRPKYE